MKELLSFYQTQLKEQVLPFWLSRCEDRINGGFFNCFENVGDRLVSRDKYIWSQGRFVWLFARLAMMAGNTFSSQEKAEFLAMAKRGRDFLEAHCFLDEAKTRCVFLTHEDGTPKLPAGHTRLDAGSGADYFVILAFSQYAISAHSEKDYQLAKNLYYSLQERRRAGEEDAIPYPLPKGFDAHSFAMSFSDLSHAMYLAAKELSPADADGFLKDGLDCLDTTFGRFVDSDHVLHEYVATDPAFADSLLARCQKPGHAIEDMWFALDIMESAEDYRYLEKAGAVLKKAFANGWDQTYGGILLFTDQTGGAPQGSVTGIETEEMTRQVLENWQSKAWWVHSETLYASLRFYLRTGDPEFLAIHQKTHELTFRVFPDPVHGEWIQIRDRALNPENRVVALPVKDPYHISRNLMYLIEAIQKEVH